jgi:transcriptional regulator with XRE-family HTH domain
MVLRPLHERDYRVFVQLLRDVRVERGLTQVELAAILGVDQSLVSKVERRERRLDIAELRRVCAALSIPLTEFVERFELALTAQGTTVDDKGGDQ